MEQITALEGQHVELQRRVDEAQKHLNEKEEAFGNLVVESTLLACLGLLPPSVIFDFLHTESQLEQKLLAETEAAVTTRTTIDALTSRIAELEEQDSSRQRRLKLMQARRFGDHCRS
jgi:hypothetical protein